MDEISKEGAAARHSVSMPSLDAVDDLPVEPSLPMVSSETSEISFTSTPPSDSLISTVDVLASESESFSSVDATPSVDPKQIIEPTQPSENDCENAESEETLGDSQAEDDPSIAIDQFIKKIADEQLSSKRSVADDLDNVDKSSDKDTTEEAITDELKEDESDKAITEPVPMEVEEPAESKIIESSETNGSTMFNENENVELMDSAAELTKDLENECDENKEEPTPKNDVLNELKMEMKDKESIGINEFEDSSEVSQDPFLIAKAQEEIVKMDVLVCGACHTAFHFLEEFQNHKQDKCSGVSTLIKNCENENKAQVWGFVLWKTKYLKSAEDDSQPSAWGIYQKWCKLSQQDKNAWITAGQSIQFDTRIGNAKITEAKGKHSFSQRADDSDPLALESVDSNKENSEIIDEHNSSNLIKKSIVKPVKLNNDVTILPSTKNSDPNSNKAIRTTKIFSTQKQEYAVEKILAKRFNPRRKTWEYQIKWENFGSDSNTWEPVSNLSHCKQMLEQFEDQLKRVKEEKAKAAGAVIKGRGRPAKLGAKGVSSQFIPIAPKPSSSSSGSSMDFTSGGRPQRNSKQKALNHMKAWCGNISDEEGGPGGVKRAHDDDDSDVDFEKKMKLEDFSDDSEDEIKPKVTKKEPKSSIKAVMNTPSQQQILPSNILIPDANGVVRINQKQLPALSSGVYIMSKTAGIIKLDSTTSKVATSGGQTIVKVAPKIGQTQIKIVKKDGNLTKQIIQVSPKPGGVGLNSISSVNKSSTPKTYKALSKIKPKEQTPKISIKPRIDIRRKSPSVSPQPAVQPEKSCDEESDDGVEPLEFPEDLPAPEPDSPPGEFTLDPSTGKVVGVEYGPDKPVIINEDIPRNVDNPSTNELENIVKLAAADITEDDLENTNAQMDSDPLETETDLKSPVKVEPVTSNVMVRYVVKNSNSVAKGDASILNKALTGSGALAQKGTQIVQRKVQRVLNQSVSQRTPGTTPTRTIIRQVPMGMQTQQQGNLVRTKVLTPKPRFNITPQKVTASPGTRIQRQWPGSSGPNRVQVYSNKQQTPGTIRKVGNAIVRPSSAQKPTRILQTVYRTSPKKEPFILNTSVSPTRSPLNAKQVINMPSLIGDDESGSKFVGKQNTVSVNRSPTKTAATVDEPTSMDNDENKPEALASATEGLTTADLSTFTMADSENPIYITGDDGTVYQVAGQNEQGQTILITQGADGQQQCLLVTNEVAETQPEEPAEEPESVLGMPEINPDVDAVAVAAAAADDSIKTELHVKTDDTDVAEEQMQVEGGQDQVVAQVVRAEPPSPGGTHKVVVMLPDGNLMVTQVSPEEFASLELE
ncbi:uncharacterized protein LOC132703984 isoform X2 [Cylas formicarius]|uniref:uncharacterized protein LOC132703984 isoform X2 n=1 Tax=Cylas formicarius TaxID=197179 RepID=UPI0029584D5D|nr:uncharacterized protein LOC132703984 isoform X2 [Cylas formicarius]